MGGNVILLLESGRAAHDANTSKGGFKNENRIIAPTAEAARKFRKEVY